MDTEQKIVACSSKGKHSDIALAIESAAAVLRAEVAELNRLALSPVIVSVSHSSGYAESHASGYAEPSGYFANIVAVINVRKNPFAR